VWRNDLFQKLQERNRSIEKRDRWRRGKGGNEMGGDDVKASEGKDPVGETLQDISEVEKP